MSEDLARLVGLHKSIFGSWMLELLDLLIVSTKSSATNVRFQNFENYLISKALFKKSKKSEEKKEEK